MKHYTLLICLATIVIAFSNACSQVKKEKEERETFTIGSTINYLYFERKLLKDQTVLRGKRKVFFSFQANRNQPITAAGWIKSDTTLKNFTDTPQIKCQIGKEYKPLPDGLYLGDFMFTKKDVDTLLHRVYKDYNYIILEPNLDRRKNFISWDVKLSKDLPTKDFPNITMVVVCKANPIPPGNLDEE